MRRSSLERGTAILESAMWLGVMLPTALVCLTVAALVHDQAVLRVVPEAALREVQGGTLRWVSNGFGGSYEANVPELRSLVSSVSQRALIEAEGAAFKAKNISTKACFWIFSVNPSTGKLGSPIQSECDSRGPLGQEVSVEALLREEVPRRLGMPRSALGEGAGYVERVILMGAAIVGEVPDLLELATVHRIAYGAISFPRQEISL